MSGIVTTDQHNLEASYARASLNDAEKVLEPFSGDRIMSQKEELAAAQAFATVAVARATLAVHDKLAEMLDQQATTNDYLEAVAKAQWGAF